MFQLYAEKIQLTVREKEPVTSGSVNVYPVRFEFSADWNGLSRKAVFRAGAVSRTAALDQDGTCTIPGEVLGRPGCHLFAGVCGRQGEEIVLPTVWANLGLILEGAGDAPGPEPPLEGWREALEGKGDNLAYTDGGELGLYSGKTLLSSVPVAGGGGAADHRVLAHRDAAEQHPIASISGLKAELDRIPEPVEAITNTELEEMLK